MKKTVLSLVQPVMVAVILLFWAFGPAPWIKNSWSLVIATSLTTALVQGLEVVAERHTSWRLTKQEFFTDLFYVILGSTVIAWLTTKLAEDPLKAVKHDLGITTQWATHLPFLA